MPQFRAPAGAGEGGLSRQAMGRYKIAVNIEWTSKCNAACAMCPRDLIPDPQLMSPETARQVMQRLSPQDVFRGVIAGYGEPTTHPRFDEFVDLVRAHPVPFDLVTNGQLLDEDRLAHLDGAFGAMIVSFSSIVPEVYEKVHVHLDLKTVMANIVLAQNRLKKTKLAISLSPMPECLQTLDQTIQWLRGHDIELLTMSPTLYDRAGALQDVKQDYRDLRNLIRRHGLHSQELDFVPGFGDILRQWWANRFKCIPRNTDVLIGADGNYMFCFNDIGHSHPIGHVDDMDLRQALEIREKSVPDRKICDTCSLRNRYGVKELFGVALNYFRQAHA